MFIPPFMLSPFLIFNSSLLHNTTTQHNYTMTFSYFIPPTTLLLTLPPPPLITLHYLKITYSTYMIFNPLLSFYLFFYFYFSLYFSFYSLIIFPFISSPSSSRVDTNSVYFSLKMIVCILPPNITLNVFFPHSA